jgi:uncharacterized protein (DUF488 family)
MTIYTIGHSTIEKDIFIASLQKADINTVVDVRSMPYSKFSPQYNKDAIIEILKPHRINYIFMGDNLGARNSNKDLQFEDGKVCFKKVQQSDKFKESVNRLIDGLNKGYRIALMCTEKDAIDCHRFALVSEYLNSLGIDVKHIQYEKIEKHSDVEQRLIEKYYKKIDFIGLSTDKKPMEQAYELLNIDIAYSDANSAEENI